MSSESRNVDALRALCERLKLEAQVHAQEAQTQRATVLEIYQLCTGKTGEPGNWNGAGPVRALVAERDRLLAVVKAAKAVDLTRIAKYLECDNDDDSTMPLTEAVALAAGLATLREALTDAFSGPPSANPGEAGAIPGGNPLPPENDAPSSLERASDIVIDHQKGSTSLVQRKLGIGYNAAAALLAQLEVDGVVGPIEGNGGRPVLIPRRTKFGKAS